MTSCSCLSCRGAFAGIMAAMADKKKKKKKPGRNINESERHTVQRKLRLPPDVDERLVELAEQWGVTVSGAVGRLVEKHDGEA